MELQLHCGCRVKFDEVDIQRCDLHAAALELLEAVDGLLELFSGDINDVIEMQRRIDYAKEIYAKARGEYKRDEFLYEKVMKKRPYAFPKKIDIGDYDEDYYHGDNIPDIE